MLEHTGDFAAAIEVYQTLTAMAAECEQHDEAAAVAHLATAYSEPTSAHDLQHAQAMSERGVALAQELGDHDLAARLLWSQMVTASHYDKDAAAQAAGEASLALCRQHRLQNRLPFVLNDLAINLRLSGRQEEGQRHAEEARAIFHAQGDLPMLADDLAQQAWSDYHRLRFADALHWSQEATTLCRKIENGWNLSLAVGIRGLVHMLLGAWGDALADFEESKRSGQAAGCVVAYILFGACAGALLRTVGALEQAQALHKEAHTAGSRHAPFTLAAIEAQLAQDAFAMGNVAQGEHWLRAALRDQPVGAISRGWIMLADLPLAVIAAAQMTGDRAQAQALVKQTLGEARRRRLPVHLPVLEIAQARCCQASGELEAAESHLQAAITLAEGAKSWFPFSGKPMTCRRRFIGSSSACMQPRCISRWLWAMSTHSWLRFRTAISATAFWRHRLCRQLSPRRKTSNTSVPRSPHVTAALTHMSNACVTPRLLLLACLIAYAQYCKPQLEGGTCLLRWQPVRSITSP